MTGTPIAAHPPGLPGLRPATLLGAVMVVGGVLASIVLADYIKMPTPSLATDHLELPGRFAWFAAAVTLLGLAALLAAVEGAPSTGSAAGPSLAAGSLCALPWLLARDVPPALRVLAATCAVLLPAGLLLIATARSDPSARRRIGVRALVAGLVVAGLGRALVTVPFLDHGCLAGCDRVALWPSDAASTAFDVAIVLLTSAATVSAAVLAWLPLRARRAARHGVDAIAVTVDAAVHVAMVWSPGFRIPYGPPPQSSWFFWYLGSLAALGAILGWSAAARLARRRIVLRIAERTMQVPPEAFEPMLADVLGAVGARVRFRTRAGWVDPSGLATGAPVHARVITVERDGVPVADIALPPGRRADVAPLIREASTSLELSRTRAEALALVRQLRASRQAVVEAADDARSRLERDLHDGAQQRLIATSYELRQAIAASAGVPADKLHGLLQDVLRALEHLRQTAHSAFPPVLADAGLGPALDELADDAHVPIELERPSLERLSRVVEYTVYLVARQAVTAAEQRGQAAQISVERTGALLRISSSLGGHTAAGLSDRIASLGGSVTHTHAGLIVEVPCGS